MPLIHNPEKALADYQRGESRDPSRQAGLSGAGGQHAGHAGTASGRPSKAADAILAKDPKNQFARALKVEVLEQMGGAQNCHRRSQPGQRSGQGVSHQCPTSNAGWTGISWRRGNLNEAFAHLQRAAQADPRSDRRATGYGAPGAGCGRTIAAVLEHANAALAIRPNDHNARLFRVIGLTGTHCLRRR